MTTSNVAGFLVFLAGFLSGFGADASGAEIPQISPRDAYEQQKAQTALLVDVREKDELVESGMAVGALSMPTSKVSNDSAEWRQFLETTSKDKLLAVYCRSGKRAQRVALRLVERGFRAANMGAFEGWKQAGLPVVYPAP